MVGIKVKSANLRYPAVCPRCDGEVTSSACFNCGYGFSGDSNDDAASSGQNASDANSSYTDDTDSND